jgi:hypothetical protein
MLSDWVSFLAYPNLFGIKDFVVVVVVVVVVVPLHTQHITKGPHHTRNAPARSFWSGQNIVASEREILLVGHGQRCEIGRKAMSNKPTGQSNR